jgi:hypothetical protein
LSAEKLAREMQEKKKQEVWSGGFVARDDGVDEEDRPAGGGGGGTGGDGRSMSTTDWTPSVQDANHTTVTLFHRNKRVGNRKRDNIKSRSFGAETTMCRTTSVLTLPMGDKTRQTRTRSFRTQCTCHFPAQ